MKSFNRLFIVWFVVVTLVFIGLIVLGFVFKQRLSEYKDYEDKLVIATKKYVKDNNKYPTVNTPVKVSIDKLIQKGYIKEKDAIDSCNGKVVVTKEKSFIYTPQIKCKNYKSSTK